MSTYTYQTGNLKISDKKVVALILADVGYVALTGGLSYACGSGVMFFVLVGLMLGANAWAVVTNKLHE